MADDSSVEKKRYNFRRRTMSLSHANDKGDVDEDEKDVAEAEEKNSAGGKQDILPHKQSLSLQLQHLKAGQKPKDEDKDAKPQPKTFQELQMQQIQRHYDQVEQQQDEQYREQLCVRLEAIIREKGRQYQHQRALMQPDRTTGPAVPTIAQHRPNLYMPTNGPPVVVPERTGDTGFDLSLSYPPIGSVLRSSPDSSQRGPSGPLMIQTSPYGMRVLPCPSTRLAAPTPGQQASQTQSQGSQYKIPVNKDDKGSSRVAPYPNPQDRPRIQVSSPILSDVRPDVKPLPRATVPRRAAPSRLSKVNGATAPQALAPRASGGMALQPQGSWHTGAVVGLSLAPNVNGLIAPPSLFPWSNGAVATPSLAPRFDGAVPPTFLNQGAYEAAPGAPLVPQVYGAAAQAASGRQAHATRAPTNAVKIQEPLRALEQEWKRTLYHIAFRPSDNTFFDMSATDFGRMYAHYSFDVCNVPGNSPSAMVTVDVAWWPEIAEQDPVGMIGSRTILRGPTERVLGQITFDLLGPDVAGARKAGLIQYVWVVGPVLRRQRVEGGVVRQIAPPQLGAEAKVALANKL